MSGGRDGVVLQWWLVSAAPMRGDCGYEQARTICGLGAKWSMIMDAAESEQIPFPGEFEVEEESPFLRGRQAVTVRRSRLSRRLRRWLWLILFAGLVVLPVGFGGYLLAVFALTSHRFELAFAEDVVLSGNRFVTREEVLNALGIPVARVLGAGMNVFRMGLEEKRKQAESIPWVRSATLTRILPNRLAVHIAERTPVAFVNLGGQVKLVDSDGVLLERPEKASLDFPVLTGLDEPEAADERTLKLALYGEFMQQVSAEAARSGWVISEVEVRDPDDLKALLIQRSETILVHFGREAFQERFQDFLSLLPEVRQSHSRVDSVDLRYRNQIVVNPQPAAPQGTGVPARPSLERE